MKARYAFFTLLLAMPALPAYAGGETKGQEVTCYANTGAVIQSMGGFLTMRCPSLGYQRNFTSMDLRIQFGLRAGKNDPGLQAYHDLAATGGKQPIICYYNEEWKLGYNGFPFQCPGYTPTTLASR